MMTSSSYTKRSEGFTMSLKIFHQPNPCNLSILHNYFFLPALSPSFDMILSLLSAMSETYVVHRPLSCSNSNLNVQ